MANKDTILHSAASGKSIMLTGGLVNRPLRIHPMHRQCTDLELLRGKCYHVDILDDLLRLVPQYLEDQNKGEFTPLEVAANHGHVQAVKFLLGKGAKVRDITYV